MSQTLQDLERATIAMLRTAYYLGVADEKARMQKVVEQLQKGSPRYPDLETSPGALKLDFARAPRQAQILREAFAAYPQPIEADSTTTRYNTIRQLREKGFLEHVGKVPSSTLIPPQHLYKLTEDGLEFMAWRERDHASLDNDLRCNLCDDPNCDGNHPG